MESPPPGTFNYSDTRTYSPAEALDVLNGVLLTKGYTLVRHGRMLVVVNLEDGIPPNLVPDVSLAELDQRFAGGQSEVNRAYAIAGSFVRDLFDRYGQDVAARILQGVSRGLSFPDAFKAATGDSLAAAESSFWDRQTFWYRWVPVLTSSVTLWMIVTLLALWAIKRRRQRDAALRRIWDAEEERLRLAAVARIELPELPQKDEAGEWVN
jgi:hypothetical protein